MHAKTKFSVRRKQSFLAFMIPHKIVRRYYPIIKSDEVS